MTAICIIPARGGSRRLPMKNIRMFHDKPIIAYSIEVALESRQFDQVVVTTDHPDIAEASYAAGAAVVWRPAALAKDEVGTQEVASATLGLFKEGLQYAACIYPTAPLMHADDIRRGFALLKNNEGQHDYAMSVGAEPLRDAGQWYIGTAAAFLESRPLIGPRTVMVPIPEERVCDINTEEDWKRADQMWCRLQPKTITAVTPIATPPYKEKP